MSLRIQVVFRSSARSGLAIMHSEDRFSLRAASGRNNASLQGLPQCDFLNCLRARIAHLLGICCPHLKVSVKLGPPQPALNLMLSIDGSDQVLDVHCIAHRKELFS